MVKGVGVEYVDYPEIELGVDGGTCSKDLIVENDVAQDRRGGIVRNIEISKIDAMSGLKTVVPDYARTSSSSSKPRSS